MWMANGSVYYFYRYLQMALRENYIIRIKWSLKKETEIDYTRKKERCSNTNVRLLHIMLLMPTLR